MTVGSLVTAQYLPHSNFHEPLMETNPVHDLEPFLLYVEAEHQAEFAVWRLASGESALALFADRDSAERYRSEAELGEAWHVYQPAPPVLRSIFEACQAYGIEFAVLNPDLNHAHRIWRLADVLEAAERANTGDEA